MQPQACICSYRYDNDAMQYKGRMCECIDGYYLYLYNIYNEDREAKCIRKDEVRSTMYKVAGKDVYTDAFACRYKLVLNMYTLEDGDTRLCVTRKQCVEKGRFVLIDSDGQPFKCLTGSECAQVDTCYSDGISRPCYYAYTATGTCIRAEPQGLDSFDPE